MSRKLSQHYIIKEFIEIHQDRYDYSLVNYMNGKIPIIIICKEHGEFLQTPKNHKKGHGCYKCGGSYPCGNIKDDFINMHGNLYDYSLVDYKNNTIKVDIICNIHGIFKQAPIKHKNGQGCPYCSQSHRYKGKSTYLYYIKIGTQYKIGVCMKLKFKNIHKALYNRYKKEFDNGLNIILIQSELFIDGAKAYNLEQSIIKDNKKYLIEKGNMILNSGCTETFILNIGEQYA